MEPKKVVINPPEAAGRKRAIIIGASTGIGRELAKILARNNYIVGLTARRLELLTTLQKEIPTQTYVRWMDVSQTGEPLRRNFGRRNGRPNESNRSNGPVGSMRILEELIKQMGGLDLIVINAGTGFINPDLEWQKEKITIRTNINGFTALATNVYRYFSKQGHGHIVGVSSVAALLASDEAPAYNASKAYMSNYLRGLKIKAKKANLSVVVTDIQPGFVDTAMAVSDRKFWMSSAQEAAEQIYKAIASRKTHAYITKRWRLIGWLLKILPDWMIDR